MPLNEKEWELVNYIEQEYLVSGTIPTADRISELGLASKPYYKTFLEKTEVRSSLLGRGIRFDVASGANKTGALTEEQLTAANVMLDLTDNRSRKKKLSDLGISTQKWEAWLNDSAFQNYLRQRAEKILPNNLHEAHLALLDRVRAGDTAAIKFYYEITGRFAPAANSQVDVVSLLMRVMEVIQRHVDDVAMAAIADDIMLLASGVGLNNRKPLEVEASAL